ncbi:MAG: DUF4143 domain-containing protein [Bacteroidales bacterium]
MDAKLVEWKKASNRKPLIIKGARQIGKTDSIVKNISLLDPSLEFVPGNALLFFDELQECPACATSLKAFKLDERYDVICSGSLTGSNYKEIESNSVGFKEDVEMSSLDFEEFLWAKGYSPSQIEDLYSDMLNLRPLSSVEMAVMREAFRDYVTLGGMPEVVDMYVRNNNFSGTLKLQRQLITDYDEDITKYATGLDKTKIQNIFSRIAVFLAKENKKFQISKVASGARNREYVGTVEWLNDAGLINICYCLDKAELPLKTNYNPGIFKLYFKDTGLLIASLDDEAQENFRTGRNFETCKGAIYENIVGDMLVKEGYDLFYYKTEKSTLEMDFFVRDSDSLIPVEVKATDNATVSLKRLIESDKWPDIKFGIKLCDKNIGFNGRFYTFPYFMIFLLKRFLIGRVLR